MHKDKVTNFGTVSPKPAPVPPVPPAPPVPPVPPMHGSFVPAELTIKDLDLRIPLKEGRQTIGRKASVNKADIPVDVKDEYMSRCHAALKVMIKGNKVVVHLEDLGSKNGTKLNGHVIGKAVAIADQGDMITLGKTTFQLKIGIPDQEATRIKDQETEMYGYERPTELA